MRAPFQILAIPYRYGETGIEYCVFHRSDFDQWQFIAGGGEDSETPTEAAKREIWEESGYVAENVVSLKSVCHIPTDIFPYKYLYNWPSDTYVVPEYSFGFLCMGDMVLSHEHTECVWLTYAEAKEKLKWDSNRTALYELNCILTIKRNYSNDK